MSPAVLAFEGKSHPFHAPLGLDPEHSIGMQKVFYGLHTVQVPFFTYLDHFAVDCLSSGVREQAALPVVHFK